MMSCRVIHTELDNFLTYLLGAGIALYITPISNDGTRVSWVTQGLASKFLQHRNKPSIAEYRDWIDSGAYSALLIDGSLLQISYEVIEGALTGHRLAYVPCPFDVEERLLRTEALLDVIEYHAACAPEDIRLRAAVRFDYDLAAAGPGHPATHLTINSPSCRIACAAPLRLGQFADFVFRHFYPAVWKLHPYLQRLAKSGWGDRTISEDERQSMHINWP